MSDAVGTPAVAPAPAAPPAPAAAPLPAPAATETAQPASSRRSEAAAQRQRGPDGKFAPREPGPTKKALMREAFGELNEPALERKAPEVADDATEERPQAEAKPAVEEKKQEQPKAPDVTDDPKTWPEPARRVHEELTAQVQAHAQEIEQWRQAGPRAIEQNRRLAEEIKLLRGIVQQANLNVDPRDLELIRYRVGEQSQSELAQLRQQQEQQAQEQQRQQAQLRAKQEAQALVAQINDAAKAAGVPVKDVGLLVHAQLGIDGKADIAAAVRDVKDRLTLQQQRVNATAPSPMHTSIPTSNTRPHDRSRAGKEARLRQWGVDVD